MSVAITMQHFLPQVGFVDIVVGQQLARAGVINHRALSR